MDEYTNVIDLEQLKKSNKVLSSIANCFRNVDMVRSIIDLEEYIKQLNFEHGSCINKYRDDIKTIQDDLEMSKEKADHLLLAIESTCSKFQNKQDMSYNDFKDLSGLYNGSINSLTNDNIKQNNNILLFQKNNGAIEFRKTAVSNNLSSTIQNNQNTSSTTQNNVTVIPPVDNTQTTNTSSTQNTSNEINTIPIGLGIAATGITASVGAVVVNEMDNNKKPTELPAYQEPDNITETAQVPQSPNQDEVYDSSSPYHASRNKQTIDKFYGENHEYYEDE